MPYHSTTYNFRSEIGHISTYLDRAKSESFKKCKIRWGFTLYVDGIFFTPPLIPKHYAFYKAFKIEEIQNCDIMAFELRKFTQKLNGIIIVFMTEANTQKGAHILRVFSFIRISIYLCRWNMAFETYQKYPSFIKTANDWILLIFGKSLSPKTTRKFTRKKVIMYY